MNPQPGGHTATGAQRPIRMLLVAVLGGSLLLGADVAAAQQATFDTPTVALDALKAAVQDNNKEALQKIFGPVAEDLKSGDPVQDEADLRVFARRLAGVTRLEASSDDKFILLIGVEEHPFPVPIARKDGKWFFDTVAGKEEILDRRIGENELHAISVCQGIFAAQREYYLGERSSDQVPEYAQKLASTPGQHDGLYWETKEGEPLSPLGPLVAQARAEGYGRHGTSQPSTHPAQTSHPYHGYLYKLLMRQGEHAPGGKYDYIINGHMVAGFALVAYPVDWSSSGVMTFIMGPNGDVFEKDLGAKTTELAAALDTFDPDETWKLSKD